MATGAYVYRDAYYGQRLILTASRSGATVNYTLQLQSTGSMSATSPYSLSGGTSKSGTFTVSQGAAFTVTIASGSYTNSTKHTLSASATMFWGGKPTVSLSVAAAGSPPGAPTNFRFERTGDTTLTLLFTKGSGATSTQITASKNGGAWYNLAEPTGTTQNVTGVLTDSYWRFNAYSKNAVGKSAVVGPLLVYTKPAKVNKPVVKVVGNTVEISVTDSARFKYGLEVACSDGRSWLVGTGTGGTVNRFTDTAPYGVNLTYRARRFVGAAGANTRVFGDWSVWSSPVTAIPAPKITKFTAERCDSTGSLNPLGTYLRIVTSGSVSSVKSGTTELNKFTRRFRRRPVGGTWSAWTTNVTDVAPESWSNLALTLFSGTAITTAYEVQMQVVDQFSDVSQTATVSTGEVAMSLSKTGAGVGKVWERGALDVGGDAYIEGTLHLGAGNTTTISGTVTGVPSIAVNDSVSGAVTFPAPFGAPPRVVFTSDNARLTPMVRPASVTSTGFEWTLRNNSNGATPGIASFHWIANGVLP